MSNTYAPEAPVQERRQSERRRIQHNSLTEYQTNSSYQKHLYIKQLRILHTQDVLSKQLHDVISQHKMLKNQLDSSLSLLSQVNDPQKSDLLNDNFVLNLEKLRIESQHIANELNTALRHAKYIENSNRQLNDLLSEVLVLSHTDELTQLPNRRAFLRQLEDEVLRVQRYGRELPIALLDIDGFKSINDKYGHAIGDQVLALYAKKILSHVRNNDMIARYGGEEFAVLFPSTDGQGAKQAMEKIQKIISISTFEFKNRSIPMPTFSAGIALYSPGETLEEYIIRADNALYRAKNSGRNLIIMDGSR